jgi:hypothetical protein
MTKNTTAEDEDHTQRVTQPLLDNEESAAGREQGQQYARSCLTRLHANNVHALVASAVVALLAQVVVFAIVYEILIHRRGKIIPVCGHACFFYRYMFHIFIFLNLVILIGLAANLLFTTRGALYFRKKIDLRQCVSVQKTESTSCCFLGILLGSFFGCLTVDIMYGSPVALIRFYGIETLIFVNYFVLFHVCAWANEDAGVSLVDDGEQKSWLV